MIFKNFADRTGSDSILSDQDWTRTEKFHSPLISADRLRLGHILLVKRSVVRTCLKLTCSVECDRIFELTYVVSCDQTAVFVSQK